MAKFTTRIELHGASERDYNTLHEAMKERGFSRTIRNSKNVKYHLPTAEYDLIGDYQPDDVVDMARTAAAETGKKAWVLVTEAKSRIWSGLPKVDED
jgi:hypothetical protein